MTTDELKNMFEQFNEEYIKFDRIDNPKHQRPDVCAFLMLDELLPPKLNHAGGIDDMVSAAEHDEIYLDVSLEDLANVAAPDLIRDLVRCGVRISEYNCLAMFV